MEGLDGLFFLPRRHRKRVVAEPLGGLVRPFRIEGCRLAGHDTRTHLMDITPTGLGRIGPALDELAGG